MDQYEFDDICEDTNDCDWMDDREDNSGIGYRVNFHPDQLGLGTVVWRQNEEETSQLTTSSLSNSLISSMSYNCKINNCAFVAKGNTDAERINSLNMHTKNLPVNLHGPQYVARIRPKKGQVAQQVNAVATTSQVQLPNSNRGNATVRLPASGLSVQSGPVNTRPTIINPPKTKEVIGTGFLPKNAPGNIPVEKSKIEVGVVTSPCFAHIACKKAVGTPKQGTTAAVAGTHKGSYGRVRLSGYVVRVTPLILEGADWKLSYCLINHAQQEEEPTSAKEVYGLSTEPEWNFHAGKTRTAKTIVITIPLGYQLWVAHESSQTATTTGVTAAQSFKIEHEGWLTGTAFPTLLN
jgi:hypothetical protein